MTTSFFAALRIAPATESDQAVLEQLWTMFRHDMSAFSGALPNACGRFRQEGLDLALNGGSGRAYIAWLGQHPVGLCCVRDLGSREQIISSFFLVHGARRQGHGGTMARAVMDRHPGPWAVAFQDANADAAAFWTFVAAEADPGWSAEHRAVPGHPELAPDSWVRFTVRSAGAGERPVTLAP